MPPSVISDPFPEFADPPVSEVAISVEFTPIQKWSSLYAGQYWGEIRKEYPNTLSQPPLPSQIETFGEDLPRSTILPLTIQNFDVNRFWFLAEPPTRLLQVQHDHFIINWRKIVGDEKYPRYRHLRSWFETEWKKFQDFAKGQEIGPLSVQQCELTYVNDIPRGEGWNLVSDSLRLFSFWWGKGATGFLPTPEVVNVAGSFRMPASKGRLHFTTQHVRRQIDNREVIQLRLTARGKPETIDDEGLLSWMDLGHEWIVRGFADLTSPEAHGLWGRSR